MIFLWDLKDNIWTTSRKKFTGTFLCYAKYWMVWGWTELCYSQSAKQVWRECHH